MTGLSEVRASSSDHHTLSYESQRPIGNSKTVNEIRTRKLAEISWTRPDGKLQQIIVSIRDLSSFERKRLKRDRSCILRSNSSEYCTADSDFVRASEPEGTLGFVQVMFLMPALQRFGSIIFIDFFLSLGEPNVRGLGVHLDANLSFDSRQVGKVR